MTGGDRVFSVIITHRSIAHSAPGWWIGHSALLRSVTEGKLDRAARGADEFSWYDSAASSLVARAVVPRPHRSCRPLPGTQAAAISTVAAGACARRPRPASRHDPGAGSPPWTLLTLAMAVRPRRRDLGGYTLLGRGRPAVSPADGLYLFAYPLITCAVGLLVVIRTPQGWRDGLVDGAAIAILGRARDLAVPHREHGAHRRRRLFQRRCSRPTLLDVVLVAALLWLLLMPGRRCASVWFLSTGLALMLAADLAQNAGGLLTATPPRSGSTPGTS